VAALRLGLEHAVGEGEDFRRGAVVGLDAVDDGPRVAVGERHDVLEVRPAPRVDALRVVAHGHEAVMGGDAVDDLRLQGVGVLVLVDQHVPEAVGKILGDLRRLDQQREPMLERSS